MDAACAAAALVGLLFNCATALKTCNDLRGKYKNVDQILQSIATEVSTLQLCLSQLQHLMQRDPAGLSSRWNVEPMLPQTFHTAIESFRKMILALLRELEKITGRRSSSSEILLMRSSKFKLLWNEAAMRDLLSQIRAHQQSLQFLLHILQIASISEIREGIRENRDLLKKLEISTRKLDPSHSKQSKRKSDAIGQGVSSISADGDSDENAADIEDEGPSYSAEPPAKRRSLSPKEGGFGTIPLSPARTRSGMIFQPTIGSKRAPAPNIKVPTSLQQFDSSIYATQDNREGILSQIPLDRPSRLPTKRHPTRRSHRSSTGPGNSLSPILTERLLSGQTIPTESLIETVEADDYTTRRKHTEIGLLSPDDSIPRSRSIRSPSSTSSWWRFEALSPPSTPSRNSKTTDASEFSARRRRHRRRSVKADPQIETLHERHELAKLKNLDPKDPHPTTPVGPENSRRKENTITPQHLASVSYQTPHIESDTERTSDSGSMDDIPYAVRREESSTQARSSYPEGSPKSKDLATLSTQKLEDKTANSIKDEKSAVDVAPLRPISKKIATEADARKHRIPTGYSLKNWDPTEEPILLLGSVFNASSLGKWIHDWTVHHHGPNAHTSSLSGDLQHLVTTLFSKIKRGEECVPHIRGADNRELVEDFIESGERLKQRLRKLLKACEAPMLKVRRDGEKDGQSTQQLGKSAGAEFVNTIFGEGQQLETTERFMAAIRLWNLRFDANCEEVLQLPKS